MEVGGRKGTPMKQEGKTLIELMVTVAIVGLVAALAGPSFRGFHAQAQIRLASEEIASELRLARQLAITRRERVRVVFDIDQRAVEAQFASDGVTHHTYQYGDKGIVIDEPSAGPEILFHPSGRCATATTIQLRGKDGLIQKLTVGITGRVSIL
jgi:type IV fimbrial biogenesis protein FimT